MMHVRVFVGSERAEEIAARLGEIPGSSHLLSLTDDHAGRTVVSADVTADAVDLTLTEMRRLGVEADDVVLLRLDAIGTTTIRRPLATVVWTDLLSQAGANSRPLARYLVFMAAAGLIAAFGVIYGNVILIVGAMAISPDLLPITAAATGLALRRWRLTLRAIGALLTGLAWACAVGAAVTFVLHTLGLLPAGADPTQPDFLSGLVTVNVSTPLVAAAAGVVAVVGLETRANTAVGVAISVTTIPAVALLGVAAAFGRVGEAAGASAVLGVNVVTLVAAGYLTLLVQRARARGQGSSRLGDDRDEHPIDRAVTTSTPKED